MGSEMCIRDSPWPWQQPTRPKQQHAPPALSPALPPGQRHDHGDFPSRFPCSKSITKLLICIGFLDANGDKARPKRRYPALVGRHVCCGFRQSIPSSKYDIWPAVSAIAPPSVAGQMKRPRSSRFAYRDRPTPSCQRALISRPLFPRKTKTSPLNGSRPRPSCTIRARPCIPLRISQWPLAIQTRTLELIGII